MSSEVGARCERGGSEVGVSVLSRTLRVGAAPAAAGCGGRDRQPSGALLDAVERLWSLLHTPAPRDAREPHAAVYCPTREPHKCVEFRVMSVVHLHAGMLKLTFHAKNDKIKTRHFLGEMILQNINTKL